MKQNVITSLSNTLAAPISTEHPTGNDLRTDPAADSIYYTLKEKRSQARAIERQEMDGEGNWYRAQPLWQEVADLAINALTQQTKDLEITAWLAEAQLRLAQFAGLADSFKLIAILSDQYWEHLYPLPNEDGLVDRMAPLAGLNGISNDGTLIVALSTVPITDSTQQETRYQFWQYRQAVEISRLDAAARQKRLAAGAISMDTLAQAIAGVPAAFYKQLLDDAKHCLTQFNTLTECFDRRCGAESPPSSRIKNALQACIDDIKVFAKQKLQAIVQDAITEDETTQAGLSSKAPSGPITSRQQALQQISAIADYFRQTEPHSPLSYLLERAVLWGDLPLPALLKYIIPEEGSRKNYCSLTGVTYEEKTEAV